MPDIPETLTDLTRERIGRLRVVAYLGKRPRSKTETGKRIRNNSRHMWRCKCECGATADITHNRLLRGLKRGKPLSCNECRRRKDEPDIEYLRLPRGHRLVVEGRAK